MKVITLRNIPPEVAAGIELRSKQTGLSLNKTVIRLLEESLGTREESAQTPRHDDLDELIGVWSAAEAEEFDDALAKQREIDPEMWG